MKEQLGYFNDDGWRYVIKTTKTPRPWYNYLGNNKYGLRIAQDGKGYSVYNPPVGHVVTHPDSGRVVYFKDMESDDIWTMISEDNQYECHHSVGYSQFNNTIKDISSEMIVFIPLNENLECWKISVKNQSLKERRLQIFPYIEWYLAGHSIPWDNYQVYSHCKYQDNYKSIVCILDDPLYPWKRNAGIMASSISPLGYECKKTNFFGSNVGHPQSILESKCTNEEAGTEACIGAMQYELTLQPNEEKNIYIVIGFTRSVNEDIDKIVSYTKKDKAENAFLEVKEYWKRKFSVCHVVTPDENLNRLINIWLKHQINQANIWCRGGGCRGYRDILQDSMGIVSFDKSLAERQIKRALENQYTDGYAPRQIGEDGSYYDIRMYSDNPVWIPMAVTAYVKETGNFKFLEEELGYIEQGNYSHDLKDAMKQVTRYLEASDIHSGSVFEHTMKAIDYLWDKRGPHGMCLILGGDWNDPLNGAGRRGKGESIWLTMAYVYAMEQMKELGRYLENQELVDLLATRCENLKEVINKYGWDGKWYLRAIDDNGDFIGSHTNKYGKIYLLPQVWSIISGVADKDRAHKVLEAVRKNLLTPYGCLTVFPAYLEYDKSVGRISVLRPGTYENSAIYCHASTWSMLADLIEGNIENAYDTYLRMNPYNKQHPPEESYSEPYVFPNCYFGKEAGKRYGQSVMGWLTATSDWIYKIITEWLIGIRPEYDQILIDPRLPESWEYVTITKNIRDTEYHFKIIRDKNLDKNTIKIITEKEAIDHNAIAYFDDGKAHIIKVLFN